MIVQTVFMNGVETAWIPSPRAGIQAKLRGNHVGRSLRFKFQLPVNLSAALLEFFRFLFQPCFKSGLRIKLLLLGVVTHILSDFHRTEVRATHRAEMRDLCAFGW